MRTLLFFLLFPLTVFSQTDTVTLSFSPTVDTFSTEQQVFIKNNIDGKRIEGITVKGYVGSATSISTNRILVDQRLFSLEEFLATQAIPANKILTERIVTTNENLYDKIIIIVQTGAPKTGRVFFKTDVAEISDFEAETKNKESNIEKNRTNKPIEIGAERENNEDVALEKVPVKDYGDFNIDDFKPGNKVLIPELYFIATRHKLRPVSYRSLEYLVMILNDKPTMVIELQGHICCKKNGKDGMDFDTEKANLSEARAQAIYYYLLEKGISPRRLRYRGFGSKYKRVEDDGDAIKGLVNRRVEVFVISE